MCLGIFIYSASDYSNIKVLSQGFYKFKGSSKQEMNLHLVVLITNSLGWV